MCPNSRHQHTKDPWRPVDDEIVSEYHGHLKAYTRIGITMVLGTISSVYVPISFSILSLFSLYRTGQSIRIRSEID